jgi:hypothetical protein
MFNDTDDVVGYYAIAPRYKGKLEQDIIDAFDAIIEQCPHKRYATTPYGKFLFDVPNRKVYMIYRRYDMLSRGQFAESLGMFIELCRKKGFAFYYEPAISN